MSQDPASDAEINDGPTGVPPLGGETVFLAVDHYDVQAQRILERIAVVSPLESLFLVRLSLICSTATRR